ncbi:hypothetical protein [Aureliella helgolandensis]|uniref:hypothetical protein n=1 Tax=Aureliella helgolandensis TaxID=2527968 RepID=UPI0011A70DA2|nr:hypothetical protein [Aureliella helgolandensis]
MSYRLQHGIRPCPLPLGRTYCSVPSSLSGLSASATDGNIRSGRQQRFIVLALPNSDNASPVFTCPIWGCLRGECRQGVRSVGEGLGAISTGREQMG